MGMMRVSLPKDSARLSWRLVQSASTTWDQLVQESHPRKHGHAHVMATRSHVAIEAQRSLLEQEWPRRSTGIVKGRENVERRKRKKKRCSSTFLWDGKKSNGRRINKCEGKSQSRKKKVGWGTDMESCGELFRYLPPMLSNVQGLCCAVGASNCP